MRRVVITNHGPGPIQANLLEVVDGEDKSTVTHMVANSTMTFQVTEGAELVVTEADELQPVNI